MHIVSSGKYGGAENVAISIIKNLEVGYDFVYVCAHGSIEQTLKDAGVDYLIYNPKNPLTLRQLIRQFRPDLIHAHDFKASILANLVAHHIPVVTHIHQAPKWQMTVNFKSLLFRLIGARSKRVIYVSDWAAKSFVFYDKLPQTRIILNGIAFDKLGQNEFPADNFHFDLLFVGRFEAVKDPQRFIQIAKKLLTAFPQLRIAMLGEGSLLNELKQANQKVPQIKFLGFQTNPYQFMARSKLVLSTSKSDAFGLTMVEAAYLGAVPIAPNVGGLAQTCLSVNGIVYQTDDEVHALLVKLLKEPAVLENKQRKLTSVDFTPFSLQVFVQQIGQVYSEVLNNG